MDAFKTHGAFSWSELITSDATKASEFYGSLFGWKFDTMDMGQGPYHVVKIGDAPLGGIMKARPEMGSMPPRWGCYVTVDDIDATAKKAVALGGQCLMGPFDIPTVGRMAVLQDPQGAVISAISYPEQPAK